MLDLMAHYMLTDLSHSLDGVKASVASGPRTQAASEKAANDNTREEMLVWC